MADDLNASSDAQAHATNALPSVLSFRRKKVRRSPLAKASKLVAVPLSQVDEVIRTWSAAAAVQL